MTRDPVDVTREGRMTRQGAPGTPKSRGDETASGAPEKIRYARAKFGDVVLICRKCAKRQGLPKGTLRGVLKRALKERAGPPSKGRSLKPRLVEVGCLGPCPKRAVAVATTASLLRGRIALIDPTGDRRAILDALLPEFGPKGPLTPAGAREDPDSGPRPS